jgi:curved DNA-binding protein CbpA
MTYAKALEIFSLSSLHSITMEEFKVLYKNLAKEHHPDAKSGSSKKFVELREAYDYLLENGTFSTGKRRAPRHHKELSVADIGTLDVLPKDELVKRYKEDRQVLEKQLEIYQKSFDKQEDTIDEIKGVVQNPAPYVQKRLLGQIQ